MQLEEIKLEDIKCEEIRQNIELCKRNIDAFIKLINTELEDDDKLCNSMFAILRCNCPVYEDDGNTPTAGYHYKVYWAYSLQSNKQVSLSFLQSDMQEQCLCFTFEQEERRKDNKARKLRFLSLHICGVNYPRCEKLVKRIDYNNDNHEVTSIINVSNATTCILEIKAIKERVKLTDRLINKLKESEN